jgi:hypothetical protein
MDKIDKIFEQGKEIVKGFKKLVDIITDEEDLKDDEKTEEEKDGN